MKLEVMIYAGASLLGSLTGEFESREAAQHAAFDEFWDARLDSADAPALFRIQELDNEDDS